MALDYELFNDITPLVDITYSNTTFNRSTRILHTDVQITNLAKKTMGT